MAQGPDALAKLPTLRTVRQSGWCRWSRRRRRSRGRRAYGQAGRRRSAHDRPRPAIGPFGFPNAEPSVDTVIVMFSTLTQAVQSLAEVGLPSARQNNVVEGVDNITPIDFA